jgi:hypothetical protein
MVLQAICNYLQKASPLLSDAGCPVIVANLSETAKLSRTALLKAVR